MPTMERMAWRIAVPITLTVIVCLCLFLMGQEIRASRARDAISIADRAWMHQAISTAHQERLALAERLRLLEERLARLESSR
jgi:hypothetical protein